MSKPSDHVAVLVAFLAALAVYAVIVIVTGQTPVFMEAIIAGLGGALAGVSRPRTP